MKPAELAQYEHRVQRHAHLPGPMCVCGCPLTDHWDKSTNPTWRGERRCCVNAPCNCTGYVERTAS